MRCLAQATQFESIEQQDRAGLTRERARAAMRQAEDVVETVRRFQTTCLACGQLLSTARGVLFQGDRLVHAACWRAEVTPLTSPLRLPASPEPRAIILVVEDHADSRDAMGLLVTELGYQAVLSANGAEALAVLQSRRPDLILCDVRMPGMDGVAFVTAVRSEPRFAAVKIVAVTGVSGRAEATRLLQAGFDGHLVKPLDYETLLAVLDRILWMAPKR
jgi:CheY-like chemotaxis protein